MRTYKSPEPAAAAVAQVSQSSQQSSTQLSIFPFLKLATLSFAIPPPISASVRSRQAGTETEREASAMEALGPGKTFKKRIEEPLAAGRASRVWGACALMRRFTGGRGCSGGLRRPDGKTNRGPARVSVYMRVCECIYTERGPTFSDSPRTVGVLIGYPVMSARFYLSEARTSPSCRGWHCVSGDLTRTFLPPSFRVVVCLR